MQISDLIARLAIDADYLDRFSGERTAIAEDIRDAIAALSLPVQPEPPEPFAYCCSSFDIDACDCVNKNHSTAIRSTGRTTTPPVPPTKGPEDDLIAAREAVIEAISERSGGNPSPRVRDGTHDHSDAVQSALIAIRNERSRAPVAEDLLAELAKRRNWELSCGEDPQWEGEMRWHVHAVNGGRNDREWTLIGFGDTPEEAIRSALCSPVAVKADWTRSPLTPQGELEAELRAGLEGVTQGPWRLSQEFHCYWVNGVFSSGGYGVENKKQADNFEANGKHLARCSPENILTLLDTIAALRAENERLVKEGVVAAETARATLTKEPAPSPEGGAK